jgi:hypothetical protein
VDAKPVSFQKNVLVVGFDPDFEDHIGFVDNARNHKLIQTKLAELGQAPKTRQECGRNIMPAIM